MEFAVIRKMDELGRIVLPADYRVFYDIKPGDALVIKPVEGGIIVTKAADGKA